MNLFEAKLLLMNIFELIVLGTLFMVIKIIGRTYDLYLYKDQDQNIDHLYGQDEITLLLHGSASNKYQFIYDLTKPTHAFNYIKNKHGEICYLNTPHDITIDDLVVNITDYIDNLSKITGCKKFNLVGNSLGGVLSMIYAENVSKNNIIINKVITINSPLRGTPFIEYARNITCGLWPKGKVMDQISNWSYENSYNSAINSVEKGLRKYYCIHGTIDIVVPTSHSILNHPLVKEAEFFSGHFGTMINNSTWNTIDKWITCS